jgi:N-acetylneuraminic acid mutarotase
MPEAAQTDGGWAALPPGPAARWSHTGVWTGSEMIVWGGVGAGLLGDGARYDPSQQAWRPVSHVAEPVARAGHTAVWTGREMVVWGGYSGAGRNTATGGRYDPATDTWAPTSTAGAPAARTNHTAVWTGTEMIVWGGFGDDGVLASGGRYNPATDTWASVSSDDAPAARERHTAVWTGTEMIIWGGDAEGTRITATGARYNPTLDTWTRLPEPTGMFVGVGTVGGKERDYGAVWTGVEMLVWGGAEESRGARYDPGSDVWQPISRDGAPSRREGHTVVWNGGEMLVWGGADLAPRSEQVLGDGGRYDPATDTWVPISLLGAPGPRYAHTAVWAGSQMLVWGGCCDTAGGRGDGAGYTPRWLVVLAATPVYSVSDEPLWIAQPGERYRVVEIESDWALAVADGDSPAWSVWIQVDDRVALAGPSGNRPSTGA